LTLEPDHLDFGTVQIGSTSRLQVTLRNSGNASGTVTGATLESTGMPSDPAAQYSVATPLPITVGDGLDPDLGYRLQVDLRGPATDRLIFSAAAPQGPLNLLLAGAGQLARGGLVCEPSSVSFGHLARGMVARQTSAAPRTAARCG